MWDLEPPSHPGDPMNQHSLQNHSETTNGGTTVPPGVPSPGMLLGFSLWTPTSTQVAGLKSCWAGLAWTFPGGCRRLHCREPFEAGGCSQATPPPPPGRALTMAPGKERASSETGPSGRWRHCLGHPWGACHGGIEATDQSPVPPSVMWGRLLPPLGLCLCPNME